MRFVGYSLAAAGASSLIVSFIIVNAVLAPVPHKAKADAHAFGWSTTVTRH